MWSRQVLLNPAQQLSVRSNAVVAVYRSFFVLVICWYNKINPANSKTTKNQNLKSSTWKALLPTAESTISISTWTDTKWLEYLAIYWFQASADHLDHIVALEAGKAITTTCQRERECERVREKSEKWGKTRGNTRKVSPFQVPVTSHMVNGFLVVGAE